MENKIFDLFQSQPKRIFSVGELRGLFPSESKQFIGHQLHELLQRDLIHRVGHGKYSFKPIIHRRTINLTQCGKAILDCLKKNPGRVVRYWDLALLLWNEEDVPPSWKQLVRLEVGRIRDNENLRDQISCTYGLGYSYMMPQACV